MYGQSGRGQNIPPTSVFDVKNAQVGTLPKPILADTVQFGSVWKSRRATLDVDFYHINFQSDYSSTFDAVTGDTLYFLNGESVTQGVEAESTILVGGGVAVYLNATKGTAKYTDSDLWVQNAPSDTETIGLTYNLGNWNVGLFSKRVGEMYNDNAQHPPGHSDRSVQHHQSVLQLHRARIVETVAVEDPVGGQQPDRQPRHHRGERGVGEVERRRGRATS